MRLLLLKEELQEGIGKSIAQGVGKFAGNVVQGYKDATGQGQQQAQNKVNETNVSNYVNQLIYGYFTGVPVPNMLQKYQLTKQDINFIHNEFKETIDKFNQISNQLSRYI